MITLTVQLETYRKQIEKYYNEAQVLLPELPRNISFEEDNKRVIKGYPTGGFTFSKSLIKLGIDSAWQDKAELYASLRGTIFHETYHIVQNFTREVSKEYPFSAIESAILEGAATVFAREYTGKYPKWAEYGDEKTMISWVEEIRGIALGQDHRHLKFFDPATDRRWVIYKTGVFVIDRAMQKSGLDIVDLRHKGTNEILKLADLN